MAYNSHGKRIRSENLAGQVTTTAWDQFACTSVDELISAAKNAKSAKHAYAYDAAGRRISCAHSGLAFTSPDTNAYLYNTRSELTNATAAVDSAYRYTYDFDDIGNRKTSSERGTNSVYTASQLNQYTAVDDFTPTYDADGNETLVKTATGIWQVTYNGENRPVRWELVSPNSNTPNSNTQTLLLMSFDSMGRRVTKNAQRFVYNGYLQIANHNSSTSTSHFNYYIWDPTEPAATRPLVWQHQAPDTLHQAPLFYTHDCNKNVSEVVSTDGTIAAHYEYAPFGAVIICRDGTFQPSNLPTPQLALANPWRFSSEYVEDDTATVYYNYRHYEPVTGRWMSRDPIGEGGGIGLFLLLNNSICNFNDRLGLESKDAVCKKALQNLWNNTKAPLKTWFEANAPKGCKTRVVCKCCPTNKDPAGHDEDWQSPGSTKLLKPFSSDTEITICYGNNTNVDESEVEQTLRHELRHAIDYCKKKDKKPFTCDEEICSEINAYSSVDCAQLSGDLKTDCVKSHVKRSAKKYAGCADKNVDEMVDLAVDNGACE